VLAELERPRARHDALDVAPLAAAVPPPPAAPVADVDDRLPEPLPATPALQPPAAGQMESLTDLARRAAMLAERQAIEHALDRFRWNRRRAAEQLGVSYKTLLNKMKECGISGPAA
jgi:DNA-binding NtrC family response regulator